MLGAPTEVIENTIFVPIGHNFGAGVHNGEVYRGRLHFLFFQSLTLILSISRPLILISAYKKVLTTILPLGGGRRCWSQWISSPVSILMYTKSGPTIRNIPCTTSTCICKEWPWYKCQYWVVWLLFNLPGTDGPLSAPSANIQLRFFLQVQGTPRSYVAVRRLFRWGHYVSCTMNLTKIFKSSILSHPFRNSNQFNI